MENPASAEKKQGVSHKDRDDCNKGEWSRTLLKIPNNLYCVSGFDVIQNDTAPTNVII